jgi:maltose alpha-D-glucosyltransferase/alpha-amylase
MSEALPDWIGRQRWFAAKTRRVVEASVEDRVAIGPGDVACVRVALDDGTVDRYAVPLLRGGHGIVDALDDASFCRALLALVEAGGRAAGASAEVVGVRARAFPGALDPAAPVRRLGGEQSNTSIAFDDTLILKHFRRLQPGANPDAEVTRFLTERTTFRNTPRLAGHLEYRSPAVGNATLAVVQELVTDAVDGWQWVLGRLGEMLAQAPADAGPPEPRRLRALARELLAALHRLGTRTGELHRALASDPADPAFAPEPIGADDIARWAAAIAAQLDAARPHLGERPPTVDPAAVRAALGELRGRQKIRHHGDFHLGQTLYTRTAADFMIIDFEGEPLRPLAERRRKHSPLRDVAGMLRSLDYAAVTAAGARPTLRGWAEAWQAEATGDFLRGYREATAAARFVPESEAGFERAVAAFVLEKAAYEVVYEANNRPDWIPIPTRGLASAARALDRQAA